MNIRILMMIVSVSSVCVYGMGNDEGEGTEIRRRLDDSTERHREKFEDLRQEFRALKNSAPSAHRTRQLGALRQVVKDLGARTLNGRLKREIKHLEDIIGDLLNPVHHGRGRTLDFEN